VVRINTVFVSKVKVKAILLTSKQRLLSGNNENKCFWDSQPTVPELIPKPPKNVPELLPKPGDAKLASILVFGRHDLPI
jgi:hypothetical protein